MIYSINDKVQTMDAVVQDFYVLDFETTGLSAHNNEIIQYALLEYRGGAKVGEYTDVVKINASSIEPFVEKLTGLTHGYVQENGKPVGEILTTIRNQIVGEYVVIHNAPFDIAFMKQHMHYNNIEIPDIHVIDTLELSRRYLRTSNHKLGTLVDYLASNYSEKYGYLKQLELHDALSDTIATGELYKYLSENYMKPPSKSIYRINVLK